MLIQITILIKLEIKQSNFTLKKQLTRKILSQQTERIRLIKTLHIVRHRHHFEPTNSDREASAIAKMKTLFFIRVFPRFSGGTPVGRGAKALEAFAFVTDKTSSLLYGAWREEKCTRSLQAHSPYSFYFHFILFYFCLCVCLRGDVEMRQI